MARAKQTKIVCKRVGAKVVREGVGPAAPATVEAPVAPPAARAPERANVFAAEKLSDDFIAALQADFGESGRTAVAQFRAERPQDYVKLIASLLPKETGAGERRPLEALSDGELTQMLGELRRVLGAREGSELPADGDSAAARNTRVGDA